MSFYKRRRPKQEEEKCADPAKARARALDALASREMSSAQLYERLCYGFTEQAAAAAVAEMVELDYVNDDRYAEARAHSLLAARKSRRAAAQNLRQKGLSGAQIEQALESVYAPDADGESPELEAAAALVNLFVNKRRDVVNALLNAKYRNRAEMCHGVQHNQQRARHNGRQHQRNGNFTGNGKQACTGNTRRFFQSRVHAFQRAANLYKYKRE